MFVPDTYGSREYFDSVICVMGLGGLILTGCVIIGVVSMYKSVWGYDYYECYVAFV